MHENPVSYKTKQQNLLRSKTQGFLKNYSQSFERVKSRSSMQNLAGTVYSAKQNKEMLPRKSASKSVLFPQIKFQNPEMSFSQAMKGLNVRASHISNYSDINTELILERRNLEEKIAFLKEEMAKQKRLNNRSEMNCRKLNNELEKSSNAIKELNIKSERLNDGIAQAKQDCFELKFNLNELVNANTIAERDILNERQSCNDLDTKCKLLKKNLLMQEKMRSDLKGELIKAQKVMNSCSIQTKELEHERAVLLLEINKCVSLNKLN